MNKSYLSRRSSVVLAASCLMIILLMIPIHNERAAVVGQIFLGNNGENHLYIEKYDLDLTGIDKDGVTNFCLPSFAELTVLDQSRSQFKIRLADGTPLSDPNIGVKQDIFVDTGDGEPVPWSIAFLRSENIPALFIDLKDASIEDIDHDNYLGTKVTLISSKGIVTAFENNAEIKGRGNASWNGDKKPYELKLPHKAGLGDMSPSKKWTLLANFFEPTKMYNKLAFDSSEAIGLEYAIESEWVDLYDGGTYLGNYLLCREPDIGPQDLDLPDLERSNDVYFRDAATFDTGTIKGFDYIGAPPEEGGYLIEKNTDSRFEKRTCGFRTSENYFTIKSPDNASRDQVLYISDLANRVDEGIRSNLPEALGLIDMDSFARRFIIEELFFNDDALVTSYYFYKKPGEDRLYAGPVWDYDGAVGGGEGPYLNTEGTILDQKEMIDFEDMEYKNPLDWDVILYDDPTYRSYLVETFKENLPVLQDLTERRMDEYYARIRASVYMDYAIWKTGWGAGLYEDPDDNYRFAKDFLSKRLSFLCERWDVDTAN